MTVFCHYQLSKFQSTLPRGERPIHIKNAMHLINISIHAPARGATMNIDEIIHWLKISIHAPARGATIFLVTDRRANRNFNPRSREGSDEISSVYLCEGGISIHAPARGATATDASSLDIRFQSTLPRGERLVLSAVYTSCENFNPRSREGSDRKYTQTTNIISVYFYLYYIIFVSLATNTAYITITKRSKCRCESPYTFC